MTREEITIEVYNAIKETLNKQDVVLELSSHIVDDLEMDSVDGITLIMDLEEVWNIHIEDEEFGNFTTIESVVNYIDDALKKDSK